MPDTETVRVVSRGFMKVGSALLGLFLAGICGVLWSTVVDVQSMRDHEREIRRNHDDIEELKVHVRSGPEWMRDRLRDLDTRIRELEKK